jgi:23S rRNA-/tRNA-specific pseudouridylate synthase
VRKNDEVRIHSHPRRFQCPADLQKRVIYETDDSILVEKPSGLPVQPTVDNVKENLISFLEDSRGQSLFPTNNLEIENDGLLLVGKTLEAQRRIADAFAKGHILRRYIAYTLAPVSLFQDETMTISKCEELKSDNQIIHEGSSTWLVEGMPLRVVYRLAIDFSSLRPKEIREKLARMGCPILGDSVHGSTVHLRTLDENRKAIAFRPHFLSEIRFR